MLIRIDDGAFDGINYRTTPDWEKAVLDLTGGDGADRLNGQAGNDTLRGYNEREFHGSRAAWGGVVITRAIMG